jgi:phosphoribosyl 1,2-cyclic phosphodiesterase/DNA-binding response OmpR family regulator
MQVRFWGTRGSIATPGPGTLRYGGNTACLEVRSVAGTLIVIDCGTGACGLGRSLLATAAGQAVRGHILISHTHWDHIQGLPFFAPLFVPGDEWDIYGPRGLAQSLRDTLAGQMRYTYFPVTLEQLGARIRYHDLVEGVFEAGDVRIRTEYLNHPALTLGYRLEADGACLVYASDHEPYARRLACGDGQLDGRDGRHAAFLVGADLVVHDAQYTAAEYPAKMGWGHSTGEYAAAASYAAGARRLALIHHDPLRDDASLGQVLAELRAWVAGRSWPLEVMVAAEGDTITLLSVEAARSDRIEAEFSAATVLPAALGGQVVLIGSADPVLAETISAALDDDRIDTRLAPDAATMLRLATTEHPALVLLDEHLPEGGIELCGAIRRLPDAELAELPVVILAGEEGSVAEGGIGVTDWLVRPFSSVYLRTHVRAWLLRSHCRWLRAPVPDDEELRLAALRRLGILDTQPEERFDRLTRLAAALFDVPMALVSLLDRDRQWLKSTCGLEVRQTSREVSFCAHAILRQEVMIVADTLLDSRFADSPVVTGEPRIRFYAGCPIALPSGELAGALCLLDTHPRQLDPAKIRHLQDLAILVERELSSPSAITSAA